MKSAILFTTLLSTLTLTACGEPEAAKAERERQETYESISSPDSRMIIGAPDNTEEKQEKE